MLRNSRLIGLMAVAAGLAFVLSGCGGGGDMAGGSGTVGVASVTGTVYAPEVTTAEVGTAQTGGTGDPVPNCPVEVSTEPGGQRLASGSTNSAGQYHFGGLPANVTVIVEANVPGTGPLMTRLQLRDGSCRADVTEETTLAAVCARYAWGQGTGPGDQELAGDVAEACLQYQAQNGYRFRQGEASGPDFGNPEDVDGVALELLAATAEGALERARTTRDSQDCERAVQMMLAQLRARNENRLEWTEQLMNRLTEALRQGSVSEEHVARVMSRIMNRTVTAEQVQHALAYMWQRLGMDEPDGDPEVVEAVAAMTMASGDGQILRLQTQTQVQAMVQMLGE